MTLPLKNPALLREAALVGAAWVEAGGDASSIVCDDADLDAAIKGGKKESLALVAPLIKFETETEVVAAANDTEFGPASIVHTRDLARVWHVSEALEYGRVGVNTGQVTTTEAPFDEAKSSGFGREGARQGLDDFFELTYICMGGADPATEAA